MEKQEYSQLELFNKSADEAGAGQRLSGTFLTYIRMYERLVLMLIGIVITGSVCFCIGVEKGKNIALSRINSSMDLASGRSATGPGVNAPFIKGAPIAPAVSAAPAAVSPLRPAGRTIIQPAAVPARISQQTSLASARVNQPAGAVSALVNQPVNVAAAVAAPEASGYTIQIASYSGTRSADQEIAALKRQGLLPLIKSSGKYTVVCVGSFPDKATAKSLLTQLKRKYRDCYIRRL